MASQSQAGNKTKQELLEYINKVRVVITDDDLNCVHVYNDDNKGSSTKVMISDNVKLTGQRMHCNGTFVVVALFNSHGTGGYMIGNVDDFTKKQCKIVNLSYNVFAIFITNDNKVALGGANGEVQFDQVDVNGKQTMIWCKKIHDRIIYDIKVHNNKIFTASRDEKCGVITMSDGSVLHMFNAPNCWYCVCVVIDDVVLTGSLDGKVYRHDMSTRTTSLFVTPGLPICTLALSNDCNILYCGGGDSTLNAINMQTNNTLLWKTRCENHIISICVQYGIICVGVLGRNVVCVNEHNGEIITTLTIKPQNNPWGIVMIPPNGAKPLPPRIVDPHKQCKEQIQQLTQERDAVKQQVRQLEQQLTDSKQKEQKLTLERDAIKQIANEQANKLKIESDKLKKSQEDIVTLKGTFELERFKLNVQIQKLTIERDEASKKAQQDAQRQIQHAQQQAKNLHKQIIQLSQQLETANQQHEQQIQQVQFQHQQSQLRLQQQIDQLSQQLNSATEKIIALETENNKFRQDQARDRLNSLITKIDNLSGPEVIQIANVFNINLTGVDTTKLATANMLAHESFDEFFEGLDVDPLLHDSLLRLYSVIKKAQEIGQFPVEHPIAPWIAQQGQPDIATRFAELNYTEEMFIHVDPKHFAVRFTFKVAVIKKLQADFIISQTSVPRLIKQDTSSGGVILVPFNPNSPKPSASSS